MAILSLIGRDKDYVQKSLDGLNAVTNLQRIISVETKTGGRAGIGKRTASSVYVN
jgi:hypothetical protein